MQNAECAIENRLRISLLLRVFVIITNVVCLSVCAMDTCTHVDGWLFSASNAVQSLNIFFHYHDSAIINKFYCNFVLRLYYMLFYLWMTAHICNIIQWSIALCGVAWLARGAWCVAAISAFMPMQNIAAHSNGTHICTCWLYWIIHRRNQKCIRNLAN